MATKETTYEDIAKALKNREYKPAYLLMGEESFFIDRICNYMEKTILTPEEQEFNQTVLYGADTEISTIINAAKRYPMMSQYQVIIIKEAQSLDKIDELYYYLQKPLDSTILIICYKNGSVDRRKKFVAAIDKIGTIFESKKMKDKDIPAFIQKYVKQKNVDIDPKASAILTEHVGSNLSRLTGEIDKLFITLPSGQTRITPEQIEKNIGISKDYNNFELQNALIAKDILKANKIINYFEENPKSNPIQPTLAMLFNFYSNLMLAYYAPEKSENGIANFLGLKNPWQAKNYITAMRQYSGVKVMQIIGNIRYCDAKSKGVNNPSTSNGDLLRELIFNILH